MIALVLAAVLAQAPVMPAPPAARASASAALGPFTEAVKEASRDGLTDAKVGQWVMYRLDGGRGRVSYWKLALVGEEKDRLGRPATWIEMEFGQSDKMVAPLGQIRMLVARKDGFSAGTVTRMFVAIGTGRAQEVDAASVHSLEKPSADSEAEPEQDEPLSPAARAALSVRTLKKSQLMTLAGTVTATPTEMRFKETLIKRIWMSEQVPILGIAKIEYPGVDHSMEVRDFGVDAKPQMVLPTDDFPKINLDPPVPPPGTGDEGDDDAE